MFIAHIGGIDALAHGLRCAVKLIEDKTFSKTVAQRYSSFDSGIGATFESGRSSLEELSQFALKKGEPAQTSGKQEKLELQLNRYVIAEK